MEFKDYYKILGVDKSASQDDIKKSYRKLAQKYHPDMNQNNKESEAKFKEISEAYEVLKNPDRRAKYDNLGSQYSRHRSSGGQNNNFDWSEWFNNQQSNQRRSSNNVEDFFGGTGGNVSDFFDRIFGGGGASQARRTKRKTNTIKGKDYKTTVKLSFEEIYNGTTKKLKINEELVNINFKSGIKDGHELKLSGKGMPGKAGGPSGDLIIQVEQISEKNMERKGNNLYINKYIDLYSMVLGGKINFKLFGNNINFNLKENTPTGKLLKFADLGFKNYNSIDSGNLYLKLLPKLPDKLTKKQKELFQKLKDFN
jgi:curved DNA-binding protein